MKQKMTNRICLVNPKLGGPYPPLGLAYLAAYLRKYGKHEYDIRIFDASCEKNVLRKILVFKPQIVGFTALSPQIGEAVRISKNLRQLKPDICQVIGGVHASAAPEMTLKRGSFDIAVLGEGEQTFCEIADAYFSGDFSAYSLEKIKGIGFIGNDGFVRTEPRSLIRDIDTIPQPARDLLDMEYYLSHYLLIRGLIGNRIATLHTSRGCPFRCTFCSSGNVFQTVRQFSPEYVVNEINELVTKYRAKFLFFTDDTFIMNKARVKAICESIIEKNLADKIRWEVQARTDLISRDDLELLKLMKQAGCIQIDYGFESGSDRILRFLKKRGVSVDTNQQAIEVTKLAGLHVMGTFMLGTPGETDSEIEDTKNFVMKNIDKIDYFQTFVTTPYPGTELYEICLEKHLVEEDYFDQIKKEENTNTFMVYSDTVSPQKVVDTLTFLNYLALKKIRTRHKVSWLLHNFLRDPAKTIHSIVGVVRGKNVG